MTPPEIDIIVPVWNRPAYTRACLVSLLEHSSTARIIIINNGCDDETENLLVEFAEGMEERALLISTNCNLGFVKAVNKGLARSDAEFAVVFKNSSIATSGWLDVLVRTALEKAEAGILVANCQKGNKLAKIPSPVIEVSQGNFCSMLLRKKTYDLIGGFDEDLDGGYWCLKDYSRRALRAGYLTFASEDSHVSCYDEPEFGSQSRRNSIMLQSASIFHERWGEEKDFCVYFPKGAEIDAIREKMGIILKGARQGHTFTILLHSNEFRELKHTGHTVLHQNILMKKLPTFYPNKRAVSMTKSLLLSKSALISVSGVNCFRLPGIEAISFDDMEHYIQKVAIEKYQSIVYET
jgi:GT2 family glycosyltransferase